MRWIIPSLGTGVLAPSAEAGFLVLSDEQHPLELDLRVASGRLRTRVPVGLPPVPQRFGKYKLYVQKVFARGLAPDTKYEVELCAEGTRDAVDRCRFRTWPLSLGSRQAPFELFLGSCYAVRTQSSTGSDLTPIVSALRGSTGLPHLKLLCGDQVYLDLPLTEVLPTDGDALRQLLAAKYLRNWSSKADDPRASFGELLRVGSNLMLSDDHEFWNNYPYFVAYGPRLWDAQFQDRYAVIARELLQLFQCVPNPLCTFRVGEGLSSLSLALLDGRYARSKRTGAAHAASDLRTLADFLAASPGPAAVVLSQPLFEPAAGWFGRTFQDRCLADMADYGALVNALAQCPHDVLVLSGDIHGGRIASARRTGLSAGSREQTILEVVSSPLSLVQGGQYRDVFPDHAYPDTSRVEMPSYGRIAHEFGPLRANHGCKISVWAQQQGVGVSVEFLLNTSGAGRVGPGRSYSLR